MKTNRCRASRGRGLSSSKIELEGTRRKAGEVEPQSKVSSNGCRKGRYGDSSDRLPNLSTARMIQEASGYGLLCSRTRGVGNVSIDIYVNIAGRRNGEREGHIRRVQGSE